MSDAPRLSPGQLAQVACIAEVVAPKAGNVHPAARFKDATWMDFVLSAIEVAPILDRAGEIGVGACVLECVRAIRAVVKSNTNLGMLLLLAPLCAVPPEEELGSGMTRVLAKLSVNDARDVFAAIHHANPGGLGTVEHGDVREPAQMDLLEAMQLASARDTVARQYVNGFNDVLEFIAPSLAKACQAGLSTNDAIVLVHLQQMAREPDSLIRRKCGDEVAVESASRAKAVLDAGFPKTPLSRQRFEELDTWLRADGNRRNPGTSADLLAAGLYAALRSGDMKTGLV